MGWSARKAAEELGISHVALLKAAKAGRVPREADGTFDVAQCREGLQQNSNIPKQQAARAQQNQESNPGEKTDGCFLEAQRSEAWLKVEQRRMKLAQERGELVDVAEVNAYVAGMILKARERFTRIGPELRDRLAQETDPVRVEEMINAEVNLGLGELTEYRATDQSVG